MSTDAPSPPFLHALDEDDRRALLELGGTRSYASGDTIFHQRDEAGGVVVLLEGRVKVSLLAPDGKEVILGFPGPGDVIGELAAIDGSPRSGTVRALEPIKALQVTRGDFQRFLAERPSAAMAVLRIVVGRLRLADGQRMDFAAYDVVGRVARRLVELCDQHADDSESGEAITVSISQDDLAAWTASSREAVSRAMHLLRTLGWIETQRRRIVVRDVAALRVSAAG